MKILMQTTYYAPHISGLTIYFQRLAEEYAKKGHNVTVLAAQHDKSLEKYETIHGVTIIRSPYLFKINKGLFLHRIFIDAWQQIREVDVVHLNLPSTEALPVAVLARLFRKKLVSTYVCDITLPNFLGSKILDKLVDINHWMILKLSNEIVSYTQDFTKHSRVLKRFEKQTKSIYPIVELTGSIDTIPKLDILKEKNKTPIIGMATRFAAEKGIHLLLSIIPQLQSKFPNIHFVFAGDDKAIGEEEYMKYLQPLLSQFKDNITILGKLTSQQMQDFYKNLDLLVVASTNSTEAFGIVQIEAMLSGVPVVASDLPGVRVPVMQTGMGEIVRVNDEGDLATKILRILLNKNKYFANTDKIRKEFNLAKSVDQYLALYT